jgi:ubiquitin-conjugating enzyme E2 G1
MPPSLTFKNPIPFHPNIYSDTGLMCISILHPPVEDEYGHESAAERWSPVQTPETILLSVISLLYNVSDVGPANVDAAKMWREDNKQFKRICRKLTEESLEVWE